MQKLANLNVQYYLKATLKDNLFIQWITLNFVCSKYIILPKSRFFSSLNINTIIEIRIIGKLQLNIKIIILIIFMTKIFLMLFLYLIIFLYFTPLTF